MAAERAEREADMALQQARTSVRDARDHVKRLELEAEAEAKAAKLKQGQAKDLGKRARPLGRKFGDYQASKCAIANKKQDTTDSRWRMVIA